MKHFSYWILLTAIAFTTSIAPTAQAGRQENKALFTAIRNEDAAAVQAALDQGADVKALSFRGTPLSVARKMGNAEIIALLEAKLPEADAEEKEAPSPTAKSETPAPPTDVKRVSNAAKQPLLTPQPACSAATAIKAEELIGTGNLSKNYNAITVDYLVQEGQNRLPANLHKEALDQLVKALTDKTTVSKDEQLEMALGTLTGIAMGAAGNDIVSDAGSDVESGYANEWSDWITSAFNLIHAGYSEEAAAFFEFGIVHIPYAGLQARCVEGLALARPDQAYDFLMERAQSGITEHAVVAMPLLGLLASDENFPQDKKEAVLKLLTDKTATMAGPENQLAAIRGLINMDDPANIPLIQPFTTGVTTDKWVKRAALRGMLLNYKDRSVVETLTEMANAGSLFTMVDDSEKIFAGLLLIRAGEPAGFEWAATKLPPKKKSFFAPKDDGPDPRPDIVTWLVRYGGDQGRTVMLEAIKTYKKDSDWMKIWIATGLLEVGDPTYIQLVKSALNTPEWDHTSVRITEALASYGDYAGLPVLEQLIQKMPPKKSGASKLFGALAGKKDDTEDIARRLASLRMDIARALGRINTPDCVPLLQMLLNDTNIYVRSSAALALTEMSTPAALDGLKQAMSVDYGLENKRSRNPNVHAHVIRLSALRFPDDPRTQEILSAGQASPYPGVQFLATVDNCQ